MNSYFIIDKDDCITSDLRKVLDDFPTFIFDSKSSSYEEAMNTILKKKPDLVFINLDDAFNDSDSIGFVLELNSYLESQPCIIGISKNRDSAYLAIKHNFIDFLLNPLSEVEIRKSILKFKKKRSTKSNSTLCLKSYKDYQYININNILFLKADNNTTDFYIIDGTVVSAYKTLKVFENNLPDNFLRIHKSYIINKDFISRINFGKLKCTLDNTTHIIPFTKTYKDNLEIINNSLTDISITSQN